MSQEKRYRYPGPQPFSADQRDLFFGRAKAIRELYRLVQLQQLVVLYAKSGLGKSSLLNAGVSPLAREDGRLEPIDFRLNAWQEGSAETPLSIVRRTLLQGLPEKSFLEKIIPDDGSLWYAAKRWQIAHADFSKKNTATPGRTPLLILDQFEELFTYPDEAVQQFARAFGEMLAPGIPQRVERLAGMFIDAQPELLTDAEEELLYQPLDVKAVIAIRSDRMSLLDRLTGQVRDILKHRYELAPLRREEAREAILLPSQMAGDFGSPAFGYAAEAMALLLDFLTKNNTQHVESFQLQILCQAAEQRVVSENLKTLEASHLGDPQQLFEEYYLRQIARLPEAMQLPARRFIEDGLVFEDEERRLSMDETQAMRQFGLNETLMRLLTATHIVRRQSSALGGFTYELSHDTLVAPVLAAKLDRTADERQRLAEEERRRKEAEVAELKQQAELERKRAEEQQRLRVEAERNAVRARQLTWLAGVVSVLAISLAVWAFALQKETKHQSKLLGEQRDDLVAAKDSLQISLAESEQATKTADSLRQVSEANRLQLEKEQAISKQRLNQFEIAEAQRRAAEFGQLLNDAKVYIDAEEWKLAHRKLRDALDRRPGNAEAKQLLEVCAVKMKE